jgi:phosphohistidine phosphatase
MRQLTLLRHAKAVPSGEGIDDAARVLAEQGRADAPRIGQALAETGAAPDIVLISNAARTRETWALAAPSFPGVEALILPELYLSPAETLLEIAQRAKKASVMLVGHNPGMHELASRLARGNSGLEQKLRAKFPTAAGAVFKRKSAQGAWRLAAYLTPKIISD